jgi:hypothetical protein
MQLPACALAWYPEAMQVSEGALLAAANIPAARDDVGQKQLLAALCPTQAEAGTVS